MRLDFIPSDLMLTFHVQVTYTHVTYILVHVVTYTHVHAVTCTHVHVVTYTHAVIMPAPL